METLKLNDVDESIKSEADQLAGAAKATTQEAEESYGEYKRLEKAQQIADYMAKAVHTQREIDERLFQGSGDNPLTREITGTLEAEKEAARSAIQEHLPVLESLEKNMEAKESEAGLHYYRNQGQYENMAINDAVQAGKTITLMNPEKTAVAKEYSQENPTGVTLYD